MNIPRRLVGRTVEVTWRDPNSWRGPIELLIKGRPALATWKEYGVLYDVTDGVVLIAHSLARSSGILEDDEIVRTALDESLIESIVVFTPEKADGPS